MFSKLYQYRNQTNSIYSLLIRNYSDRRLIRQIEKNPHLKHTLEEQWNKKQPQGILKRLVDKRTSEYKEYFSRIPEPSIVKRPRSVSYDHIGQKRALHLTRVLRAFVVDRIGSGEIGDILSSKDFQITNIIVPVDLNRIEILWWSPEQEVTTIEELLKTASEDLKSAICHAQLLPALPPIVFKRDECRAERDRIDYLIDTADKGTTDEEPSTASHSTEPKDLYDPARTAILEQLSKQTSVDDAEVDARHISPEQLQRRMKAFALAKKLKRVKEQRSAIYGIMAIEQEKRNAEHFALHSTTEDDLTQHENKN